MSFKRKDVFRKAPKFHTKVTVELVFFNIRMCLENCMSIQGKKKMLLLYFSACCVSLINFRLHQPERPHGVLQATMGEFITVVYGSSMQVMS